MKGKTKNALIVIGLIGVLFVILAKSPVWGQFLQPPLVRFTGTFYPQDTKDVKGGIETFKVVIDKKGEKKEWIFGVNKAENLHNPSQTGLMIVKDIFPRIITLKGPPEILAALKKPELAGKIIKIEGSLYRRERFMMVDTVEVADQETK